MRWSFAALALVAGFGAARAEPYANARYGFSIDVPAAIGVGREEPDDGDGLRSHSADGKVDFVVWAGFLLDENGQRVKFATEMKGRLQSEAGSGAKITYQMVDPKGRAAFSSVKDGIITYERAILSCAGGAIAAYRLEYPLSRKAEIDPVIAALNASFIDGGGCKLKP